MHSLFSNYRGAVAGNWDTVYYTYLREISDFGETFTGRNGETKALFGCSITADLEKGFPLTQLRKMPFRNLCREFLFDIGRDQNVSALGPAKHFWDFLADENGDLGASAYNRQWRMWPPSKPGSNVANEKLSEFEVDQLQGVIDKLRRSPNTRHATAITHNPTAIDPGCPPCHLALQFMPSPSGKLNLMVPARSNDMVVGFPLDIARYAILTHVIAKAVDMKPGSVYMPSSNSHIYENCYEIVKELLTRESKLDSQLTISSEWDARGESPLESLQLDYFSIESYDPHDAIKVSVN